MNTPPRVLYVDDDDGLRALVRRTLERRGYKVEVASSGEEGFARVAAESFDLVALDHFMPGQGGLETLQAIQRELSDPPPIVYVTGADESRVAVAALKAGAADYVVKTVGEEFFDLLDRAFKQSLDQLSLRREKLATEAALLASNARLEALLREVNHRVANSLQMVSAFVQMQASAMRPGPAHDALKDTQRRIEAIIQVHRRLYTSSDVERIDMQEYLTALARELEDTCSTRESPRTFALTVDAIQMEPDRAVSVGVILNELVANACKYAYPDGEAGAVRISLTHDDRAIDLVVEDDGCGMQPGLPQGTGLGGRLIKAMAHSLSAELTYDAAHSGVRARLKVPAGGAIFQPA